jgi:hypothetical protein
MCYSIDDTFGDDIDFLTRNGLVEAIQPNDPTKATTYRLTELGRVQAESMAARHTVVRVGPAPPKVREQTIAFGRAIWCSTQGQFIVQHGSANMSQPVASTIQGGGGQ